MARWPDLAVWHQAADNFGDGDWTTGELADRMLAVQGIAMHVAQGSGPGTVSWCANPSSDVGPHFVVDVDGAITQMVDTGDYSWCQADGNRYWLSVENAGWSGSPLTAAQVEANARLLARAHQVHGVPLQVADSPSGRGLGWHGMGGAAWGGHPDCPGEPIKAQRPAIIARAGQIVGGGNDVEKLDDDIVLALRSAFIDKTKEGVRPGGWFPAVLEKTIYGKLVEIQTDVKAVKPAGLTDAQVAIVATAVGNVVEGLLPAIIDARIAVVVETVLRRVLGGLDDVQVQG